MFATRIFNAFLSFLPADIDRRAYDNKSYRAVLREELERQELIYKSRQGYFLSVPDSAFASHKVLADYLAEDLLWNYSNLPEVADPALLIDPPIRSVLLRDLSSVYGMYKARAYLKRCFGMSYAEWKAAYDAEQSQMHSRGRKRKSSAVPAAESDRAEVETNPLIAALSQKPLSTEEAAAYLGITRNALYKLTSQRLIKHSKPTGRKIYFSVEDLNEWAKQNKVRTTFEIEAEMKGREPQRGNGKRR